MSVQSQTRFDRRKATTRAKIYAAGEELFATRGYEETSVEDIAMLADVAVRTIYLHFSSKAAIMMAQFDGWLGAFVDAINARPVAEPIAASIPRALAAVEAAGWPDRAFGTMDATHPMALLLAAGNPEIAGHFLQQWHAAQERLVDSARERSGASPDDLRPRARAAAVFSVWVSTVFAVVDGQASGALDPAATGNRLGEALIKLAVPPGL